MTQICILQLGYACGFTAARVCMWIVPTPKTILLHRLCTYRYLEASEKASTLKVRLHAIAAAAVAAAVAGSIVHSNLWTGHHSSSWAAKPPWVAACVRRTHNILRANLLRPACHSTRARILRQLQSLCNMLLYECICRIEQTQNRLET